MGTRDRTRPDESRKPSYITAEGYRRLEEEAHRLWTEERPRLAQAVAVAAAEGDRSENAEYIYGKRKLAEIDRRLKFLSGRLDVLTIVDQKPRADGKVYFGCYVTVEDEAGERACYRLVGPDETGAGEGFISIESPMARALLGKEEGDEVTVVRPRGAVTYVIDAVDVNPPGNARR
ncbi:MAG: transcription elongation factor GreB [Myxococcales bacterium]|nr:transcription elongation factor GreB [Myxococcales bacterium]